MTTTSAPPTAPALPASVQLRPRTNPRLIAIGVLLAVVGALVMAWAWGSAHQTREVLVATQPIYRGEPIEPGDLAAVSISVGDDVVAIDAENAETLVGQYAQTDIASGALIHHEAIGTTALADGMARVGLKVAVGRLPSTTLVPGSVVQLVEITADGDSGLVYPATVVSVPQLAIGESDYVVDLELARVDAPAVAALAATDQIVVVQVGGR